MKSIIRIIFAVGWIVFSSGSSLAVAGSTHALTFQDRANHLSGSPFKELVENAREDNHYIYILDIGDAALLSRIHLIRAAQKTIDIQTFIWTNDETGRYFAYELLQAAKRGVKVRIMVDRWKSNEVTDLVAFMSTAHENMEIRTYNPPANQVDPSVFRLLPEIALKFKKVNQRMHNKTFIIDNRIAMTGGRNYENDYYDRGVTRNFKDRDVLVIGPVVNVITESFNDYWDFDLSIFSKDLTDVGALIRTGHFEHFDTRESFRLGNLFKDTDILASDNRHIKEVFVDRAFPVKKVKFVFDKPGKNDSNGLTGSGRATVELAKILFEAQESIIAQTPYLVLDKMTVEGVRKLRRKNPDVDILISSNSLAATDNIYAYSFSYKQKKLFVENLRFRIFELKPVPDDIIEMMPRYALTNGNGHRTDAGAVDSLSQEKEMNTMESPEKHLCIHAKSFVVDDRIAWIGSFNLDPRSVHLNTEVGLVIWDEAVAKAMKATILRDTASQNSWTIGKRKEVPLISAFSGLLGSLVQAIPIVDIWPFRFTSSFKLKEGKAIVPFYDERFYDHYISVGSFPGVSLSLREIEIRLLKAFTGVVLPII